MRGAAEGNGVRLLPNNWSQRTSQHTHAQAR